MQLKVSDNRVEWSGGHLELPVRVKEAIQLGKLILVIHDYMAYDLKKPAPNLVAYNLRGERFWAVENLTRGSPTDAYMNFISEEPLCVGNFLGFDCKIDSRTGKLIEKIFTK